MTYISREAAIVAISKKMQEYISKSVQPLGFCKYREDDLFTNAALGCRAALEEVKALPAADVREVKRGKWKRVVDFTGVEAFGYKETMIVGYGCNVCGYEVDVSEGDYNFCPNCGADMRNATDEKV